VESFTSKPSHVKPCYFITQCCRREGLFSDGFTASMAAQYYICRLSMTRDCSVAVDG